MIIYLYVCVFIYIHTHLSVCICIYVCVYETIIQMTYFKQYFTVKNILYCIQSIIYIDCVEYTIQEKKKSTELDLFLWHVHCFRLIKSKPKQSKFNNVFRLLPLEPSDEIYSQIHPWHFCFHPFFLTQVNVECIFYLIKFQQICIHKTYFQPLHNTNLLHFILHPL